MTKDIARGTPGHGSVYQSPDGLWRFAVSSMVDGRRVRKVRSNKSREVVEAIAAEHRAQAFVPQGRTNYMAAARALGTHTRREMRELHKRAPRHCAYCKTRLNWLNSVTDHIIPVSRGGSDAIDNIQIICWECNTDKRASTSYEYVGPPRPFKVFPKRQSVYDGMRAAKRGAES